MHSDPVLRIDACPAVTGHLSSPEIIYHRDRFILYYHGNCPDEVLAEQNRRVPIHSYHRIQNSGAATSSDGVHFDVHAETLLLPITTPDHWRAATNVYLRVIATEGPGDFGLPAQSSVVRDSELSPSLHTGRPFLSL